MLRVKLLANTSYYAELADAPGRRVLVRCRRDADTSPTVLLDEAQIERFKSIHGQASVSVCESASGASVAAPLAPPPVEASPDAPAASSEALPLDTAPRRVTLPLKTGKATK
jgi:hypothetical protein